MLERNDFGTLANTVSGTTQKSLQIELFTDHSSDAHCMKTDSENVINALMGVHCSFCDKQTLLK